MKTKLVRESLMKTVEFSIKDLCDGTIGWKDIESHVKERGTLPDPGFYMNKDVKNEEDLAKYLEQFQERFGCEGMLTFDEWGFAGISGNKKYTAAATRTSDAVGYGKNRYMGD